MTVYNEKHYRNSPEEEITIILKPSFTSLLSRPFQCLPGLGTNRIRLEDVLDDEMNIDMDERDQNIEEQKMVGDLKEKSTIDDVQNDAFYEDVVGDVRFDDDDVIVELPYKSSGTTSNLVSSIDGGEKLIALRKLMKHHGIGVYIIPSEDEHQTEYTAVADKRREYISGFTGSAGIAIVTLNDGDNLTGEAAVSTDGRYFLQAEKQLDLNHWTLLKQGLPSYPKWTQYCINKAIENSFSNVISCDPRLISLSVGEFFERASNLQYNHKFEFKPLLSANLVDQVWGADKPQRSLDPVFVYDLKYAGVSVNDKLIQVRDQMKDPRYNGSHLIITALDEVSWLLNLRSSTDIDFTPTFFSYVIVSLDDVTLYINEKKLKGDESLSTHLSSIDGLVIKPYESFYSDLGLLKKSVVKPNISIILPSKSATNYALLSSIPQSSAKQNIVYSSIVSYLKIYKNSTELYNGKIAQYKDSLAFILFSSWLEDQLVNKHNVINEYEAACKIHQIRSKFPNFISESYETISSSGPNGAIIHYAPSKEDNSIIDPDKIYLIDSGAQYLEGTTDITRTYKFGDKNLLAEDKKFYTLVLKGHLGVSMSKFPPNTSTIGAVLDAYSRQPLWNEGLDFNHGSGHGVGAFGNVHESPLYILTTSGGPNGESLFKKGAVTTIEPGYYVDGSKGFRIESELEVIQCDKQLGKTRNGEHFLGFNYWTKIPFCRKLIDKSYLTDIEVNWINEFNKSIRTDFCFQLLKMGEKKAYDWLMKETAPI